MRGKAAGERLVAVAVELTRRGLEVTVVDYHDASRKLEVVLPPARHLGPVMGRGERRLCGLGGLRFLRPGS
jgi:hypothetical protein